MTKDLKFLTTTSSKLNIIPIVDGQVIALSDKNTWYYDMGGIRHSVTSDIEQAINEINIRLDSLQGNTDPSNPDSGQTDPNLQSQLNNEIAERKIADSRLESTINQIEQRMSSEIDDKLSKSEGGTISGEVTFNDEVEIKNLHVNTIDGNAIATDAEVEEIINGVFKV